MSPPYLARSGLGRGILTLAALFAALISHDSIARGAGQDWPQGEGYQPEKPFKSTKTRAQVKAETLTARDGKALTRAGQEDLAPNIRELGPSLARPDRKAETRADAKAHRLPPAGQG